MRQSPFQGHNAAPATLAEQVAHLRRRFGLEHIALVGDRGLIAQTRIDQDLQPAGPDWVTALRHNTVRKLARKSTSGPDCSTPVT